MKLILHSDACRDVAVVGNKAGNLAILKQAGFDVPEFVVIPTNVFTAPPLADRLQSMLPDRLSHLAGNRFAVRSSSVEEDGAVNSFAGQFASFLDVAKPELLSRARQVAASGQRDHVVAYRQTAGATSARQGPAVMIQEMVDADAAGVAFAADPVSGDRDTAVVAATCGTGESLVGGELQGDTWHVDPDAGIACRSLEGGAPVLTDAEVRAVVALVREVSAFIGRPQDIEWAIRQSRLYLLQSRDITALKSARPDGNYALWDNSNIVESYGGVTTPLTFTVAREAYQEAYRHMGRVLGVSEKDIAANERAYAQMIGLIRGRVYYNLLNWYRLLLLTPGFRFNRGFMEQMMGVTEGLPDDVTPKPAAGGRFAAVRSTMGLARVACRLVVRMITHNRDVRRFHRRLEALLVPVDLSSMNVDQLIDYYEHLQQRVIRAWDTPLVNDLFCMIFHGALRQVSKRWLADDMAEIHNDLVAGEAGIVSLEPVRRMRDMANTVVDDPLMIQALRIGSRSDIEALARRAESFSAQRDAYLERFGDRCLDELKLESQTLCDDPLPLYRAVGQLASTGGKESLPDDSRQTAECKLAKALSGRPLRRRIYGWLLCRARTRVRDRENLRFERTRVYGRVRAVFVEIGRRFAGQGQLADAADVFYLQASEIEGHIRGTGIGGSLLTLVASRRAEFQAYCDEADLPRRFVTCGPPQLESSMQLPALPDVSSADSQEGQACSPGIVRGPVRIVRDPRNTDFRSGEILVAERTDPGWVTIFPLVKGMIMERGSLLSHSAIVARELGIPAVVGVDDACRWLVDGDWVELDGSTGVIRKLQPADVAA